MTIQEIQAAWDELHRLENALKTAKDSLNGIPPTPVYVVVYPSHKPCLFVQLDDAKREIAAYSTLGGKLFTYHLCDEDLKSLES